MKQAGVTDISKAVERAAFIAGEKTGEDPLLLIAIADRESLRGRALAADGTGDGGNAVGPWQIDRRYHREFLERHDWRDFVSSAIYAAGLLAENRRWAEQFPVAVRERAAIAAYNASRRSVERGIRETGDPDQYTTGGDYGADVLRRRMLLGEGVG